MRQILLSRKTRVVLLIVMIVIIGVVALIQNRSKFSADTNPSKFSLYQVDFLITGKVTDEAGSPQAGKIVDIEGFNMEPTNDKGEFSGTVVIFNTRAIEPEITVFDQDPVSTKQYDIVSVGPSTWLADECSREAVNSFTDKYVCQDHAYVNTQLDIKIKEATL